MYRKFSPQLIFNGTEFLKPGSSLITTEEGVIVDIAENINDGEKLNGILSPGFINCHCHLELSHLKGKIPKGTGLVEFVKQVMKIRDENKEEKIKSINDAIEEVYNSGTVAVGDICNTSETSGFKDKKLSWRNFIEVSGFVDTSAQKRLNIAEEVLDSFSEGLITPHAPYSVSKTLFKLISDKNKSLISIHNQESEQEDLLYKSKTGGFLELYNNFGIDISNFKATGKTSFESWLPFFKTDTKILSVHNTFISESDLQFAATKNYNIWFCICVNANLYIENSLPPIELLRKNNCKIVIGTDSLASNDQLKVLDEIKELKNYFPFIPLDEILSWATSNGAAALGFNELGSFEKGKKPGIIQIENATKNSLDSNSFAKRIL